MRLVLLAALATYATPAVADAVCGKADVQAVCDGTRTNVSAGPNPQDAPVVDANTTYAVAGFAANRRSYLAFEAQSSGEYTLYLGGAPGSARIREEFPSCVGAAPRSCMRSATTYVLVAGERYEIELGPVPPGQRVLLHVAAATDEDHLALRSLRGPGSIRSDCPVGRQAWLSGSGDLDGHGHRHGHGRGATVTQHDPRRPIDRIATAVPRARTERSMGTVDRRP